MLSKSTKKIMMMSGDFATLLLPPAFFLYILPHVYAAMNEFLFVSKPFDILLLYSNLAFILCTLWIAFSVVRLRRSLERRKLPPRSPTMGIEVDSRKPGGTVKLSAIKAA